MSILTESDYPALYGDTNSSSMRGQRRFLTALRVRLGCLIAAAIGGAVVWEWGEVEVGGAVALIAFLAALGAEMYRLVVRPEREWYEGRAAAESVKTLTWRYMVQGESFEKSSDSEAESRFLAAIRDVLKDLDSVRISGDRVARTQITPRMRELRSQDFPARRKNYLEGRINDQRTWYESKAAENERQGHKWTIVVIVFEMLGAVGAALVAFGGVEFDLLGVLAAVAAGVTGWVQAKQHENLSTAYAVAARELTSIGTELELLTDESRWATFVGQSEEAISREHTLWRASKGLRLTKMT